MINIMERYLISALVAVLVLSGCSANEPETPAPTPGIVADTYLKLSIATADTQGNKSRATEYESPVNENEKIKTMRFIILDGSGHVEHNVLLTQTDNPDVLIESNQYRVTPNETKTVYLIGNESSIPDDIIEPFRQLRYGDVLPKNWDELTLSRPVSSGSTTQPASTPLYTADQPIPMTEFHEIEIGGPQVAQNGVNIPYQANLFVTRTAVKFTFNLTINVDNTSRPQVNTIDVGNIIIDKIADKEFLFPNATEYSDPKVPVNHNDRTITAYSIPKDVTHTSFSIPWKQGSDIFHYTTGDIYLPESKYQPESTPSTTPYSITLPIDGVNLSATLPNLPDLPRNTHVIVDITVDGPMILCEVALVPYIGITLDPEFGILR